MPKIAASNEPGLSLPLTRGRRVGAFGSAGSRLAILLCVVLLLLCASFAAITIQDHDATLEEGWVAAERAALGAVEHAGRSLAAARLVTDRVADTIRRDGGAGRFRGAGNADLAAMLENAPQIGGLFVIDAAGRLVASSDNPAPPPLDVSDRPYFAPLRAGAESHLAPLLRGRIRDLGFFSFNRAVRDDAGNFLGVVQAAMRAAEFMRFQRGLGLGPEGRVGLFLAADGALLMVHPWPSDTEGGMPSAGPLAPTEAVLAAIGHGELSGRLQHGDGGSDGLLVAWQRGGLAGNLLAAAALPRAQALAPFRDRLLRNALLFGVAGAMLAGLGWAVAVSLARGVASRREAETERRALAMVLEAMADGVFALDGDWRFTFMNTRGAMLAAAGRDVIGQVFQQAYPGAEPFEAAYARTMRDRVAAVAEAYYPPLGCWFRAESHPREDGGIVVFFRDVTEERAAAARLAESEARLRRVMDSLFVFVGLLAPDGTLLEANRAPLEAAGLTLAEVQGRAFWDCPWWSHDAAVRDRVREACARAAEGAASRFDVEVRMRGDSRMTMDFQIAPLRDAEGRVTHLIPSASDVTARTEAEAALAGSEARLRLAQEAAGVGVFETDLRRNVAYWSSAMFDVYGLDRAHHAGGVERGVFLALVHPEDREALAQSRMAILADRAESRFRFEFRIIRADTGELRWVTSRGEVVRDATGEPLLLRGVAYDVTDRRRAEERQMMLAREVDHRAKNALAVVQAIVGLTRTEDPGRFREAVTGRIAAMARAHTLLAREGWGSAMLRELIAEELAPHRADFAGQAEAVSLAGPPVALAPDAAQPLAMALHELATNAAKYGALSTPGGRVAIAWEATADGGLALRWTETGGPALEGPPERRGFGSSVIRNTVERQLGGRAAFDWPPAGLDCRLTLPASQLRWPA